MKHVVLAAILASLFAHAASAQTAAPGECTMSAEQCERLENISKGVFTQEEEAEAETDADTDSTDKSDKKPAKKAVRSSTRDYTKAMIRMHKAMKINYTGNMDTDFTAGMIPHHQGAVDMAQVELKYGKDEELRKLAKQIIIAQKQEIVFMKTWLSRRADRKVKLSREEIMARPSVKALEKANASMHKGMNIRYTGNADVDFALGMIPHHQGAVDMAKAFLEEGGQDPKLHKLARDILLSQNREIHQMQSWLEDHPAAQKALAQQKKSAGKPGKKAKAKAPAGEHSHH